jgi:nucleoside-diphosphate-sugar epimerase
MVGANLVRALLRLGSEVHIFVREPSSWRLRDVASSVTAHTWHMQDQAAAHSLLSAVQPKLLFHCATGRAPASLDGDATILKDNVLGAWGLLQACLELPEVKVVMLGSSTEYGRHQVAMHEEVPCLPDNMHGISKLAVTAMVRGLVARRGLNAVVLRLFHVYGPFEAPHRLIPTAIRAALQDEELRLTQRGFVHDYIHVSDVVRACLAAGRSEGTRGEIFNVATGVATDNHDVVAMLSKIAGRSIRTTAGTFGARETDRSHWCGDVRKIGEQLSWRPEVDLETGLRMEWERALRAVPSGS